MASSYMTAVFVYSYLEKGDITPLKHERPKTLCSPRHEYSSKTLNLCGRDYWKATDACRVLPKAWLESCYASDSPDLLRYQSLKIKVGSPLRSSQPFGILSRWQNPIRLLSKTFWMIRATAEGYNTAETGSLWRTTNWGRSWSERVLLSVEKDAAKMKK